MSSGLLMILTFLAGALAVLGLYSILSDLFMRERARVDRRLNEEFSRTAREQIRRSPLFKDVGRPVDDTAAEDEPAETIAVRFRAMVEQSGLTLTPARLLGMMAGAGLAGAVAAGLIRQNLIAALFGALIGAAAPYLYVRAKRNARLEKLRQQLPDAFDLMGRVIRAGQTTAQAFQAVADEFDQPIAGEFAYSSEQQNFGLSPEIALRDLARRSGLLEIKIFVLALMIQQQTGGNLAEVLDNLATVMRERFKIAGKIKALTAEGRMQAIVLLALPVLLLILLTFLNPKYADVVSRYPYLIVGMLVMEGLGAIWIRKIVNFDY